MKGFFYPKSVAVIGASSKQGKVGNVILRNLIDGEFKGKIFPINPGTDEILGLKCYSSVKKVKDKIDLAMIAIPANFVIKVLEDCGKKKIKNVVIISAGFEEIGNKALANSLSKVLKKYKIKAIGPNCLGILNTESNLDTLFLPRYRLQRPKKGGISFVCQSGAVGSTILDLVSKEGFGVSKFVSYGNATDMDEADIIDYLNNDKSTDVICLYVEAVKEGKKFMEVCKRSKKPIIALKGGTTLEGSKAALSHTGSLAGSAEIYSGVFKQCNVIQAHGLEEMFDIARLLEHAVKPRGKKVQIVTNGGGFGILCADALSEHNLPLSEMNISAKNKLKKSFPDIAVVSNPMDLLGDATTSRYNDAILASLNDKNVDILLLVILYQTPLITTDIVDIVTAYNDQHKKPIVVVSTGGSFTEVLMRSLEDNKVPCYSYPRSAVRALKALVEYYEV